jgi:hypothetical protein
MTFDDTVAEPPSLTSPNSAKTPDKTAVDTELEAARNRINALVYLWMSVWDKNTGDAAPLLDLLSPEGFTIELVEEKQTITTIEGVKAWFAKFPTLVKQDNHIVESIDVSRAGDGRWRSITRIRAPGITAQDQPFAVSSYHDWQVVDYGGPLPRIASMNIKLVHDS